MGYQLQSVFSISPDDRHHYFVYLVESWYRSEVHDWFDKNFSAIAADLGPKGVIVRGLDRRRFADEIHTLIHEQGFNGPFYTALYGEALERDPVPYYLLSNKPPERFGEDDCQLLLIPLLAPSNKRHRLFTSDIDRPYGQLFDPMYLESITRLVVNSIANGDLNELRDASVLERGNIRRVRILRALSEAVEVKPSLFGVLAIDLKKLLAGLLRQ